ncbi:phosphodiester glycosidase family protein [Actinoplanes sp. KI2]|uniref:phosphodiester glycosidase family protein n=1 Tax=Actinoplanes sp. KI2 TaxID=2983315 RepID=UPI0021D60D6C|nr:phosphodiester glycosidase family protein [Actinoplanes sp. KI2]MCU7730991.1 phosphodiester glycosidase family protein [Actinoplanes sp. KI2]
MAIENPEDRQNARRKRPSRRVLIVGPVLVVLLWATVSYTTYMLRPSSLPWGVRSVEWVRQDVVFGNWLADEAERIYYTATAPKKGGSPLPSLPSVGLSQPPAHAGAWPPPIEPIFPHPLPGEGAWKPTGPPVNGGPPVLVTTFRPELDYPRLVAYVAWFDHTRSTLGYYPGRYEPPHAAVRGPAMVPDDQRSRLLATFNGGFTYADGHNGSADNGRTNEPLKNGNATLLGYRDGRIAMVTWSGGPDAGPDVAWARQSLAPIIWNGQLNPQLNTNPDSPQWGYTLGGRTRVWRTGVGIDRRGNLIYVAADGQTVITLAKILQHLGAIRAMEFDINPEWHTLITYTQGSHGLVPTMLGPNPMQAPTRYLVPDDRDFFTVYRPLPGPVTVPFG